MIIQKTVMVGLNGCNAKIYENLGYVIPREYDSRGRYVMRKGTKIEVKIEDLLPTKIKVQCKCEDCGLIRGVEFDSLSNVGKKTHSLGGGMNCFGRCKSMC